MKVKLANSNIADRLVLTNPGEHLWISTEKGDVFLSIGWVGGSYCGLSHTAALSKPRYCSFPVQLHSTDAGHEGASWGITAGKLPDK